MTELGSAIRVTGKPNFYACNVKTLPYPGFPTDMQPLMGVCLSLAEGTGIITESIYENRFKYVDELAKMGVDAEVRGTVAVFKGSGILRGAEVNAPDLRAGAALVLAGLAADGYSVVNNIEYVLRGYEDFDGKLRELGAEIAVAEDDRDIHKFKMRVG